MQDVKLVDILGTNGGIIWYYDQPIHNYFPNYQCDNLWNNCVFVGHSTK